MSGIRLRRISKTYQSQVGTVRVISSLDLDIPDGELLCIVGPSGCGKTTLLGILAGLVRPDSGTVEVGGVPVTAPDPRRGLVFQQPALFPWLRVSQNVGFGLKMAGMPRVERDRRVARLLQTVGLSSHARALPHELSGGMKQRVALATALAPDPGVLLLDEPFAALDAQARDELHEELEAIWLETGKTMVFVTHNVREAARLGTRVLLMAPGGHIAREYPVELRRGRHLEDPGVAHLAAIIRDDLRTIGTQEETISPCLAGE